MKDLKIKLNDEALSTLLRSNLSCHLGKIITQEALIEISQQIIDSISYFINQEEQSD